ncbi:MAG: hypothetical protein ILM98_16035 [Kiritimatiellae bacterium]|nr:hypothetical protein [Kiritimatiellia bacterium]
MRKAILLEMALCAAMTATASATPHIAETMTLAKGWNAIYLESTPTNAVCDDFFAGAPVVRVASYYSDAYSSTRQLADDGTEISQKPVSYHVWIPGDETASTMSTLAGGRVYVILTTEAWSSGEFLGVPAAPKQTWRTASSDTGFMNLAGVSADTNATPTAKAYFGEGPFGTASGSTYQIGGNKTAAPTFLPLAIGASPKLHGGMAYALTATKDGDWPGVIGARGDGVIFGSDENFAVFRVQNCGTKARLFRFTVERSASGEEPPPLSRRLPRIDAISAPSYTNVEENVSWELSLEAGEVLEQIFSLDRAGLEDGMEYGAILKIEDLGGSMMRVRLPIAVEAAKAGTAAYPAGLWIGEIALTKVSGIDDVTPTPVAAGGTLKMNVMVHVDTNGTARLLQRVAAGIDTNGTARLFKNLEDVPAEVESPRRISTVMMSVDTPVVAAADGSAFGTNTVFTWTIAPTASDNPFRHAWHPDHDGKTADYRGEAPSGDDFENYAYPIKPELWSIGNTLELSWHENGDPALPVNFPYSSDETTSGVVTWEVTGLAAKGPIKSVGTFTLKRVFKARTLE